MSVKGPIIIAFRDNDDQDLVRSALESLAVKNRLLFFSDGEGVFEYLLQMRESPFIILADLKMPRVDGLELCGKINENEYLKKKSIPYILFAEVASRGDVNLAYETGAHGFFLKPNSLEELTGDLGTIVSYWKKSVEPTELSLQN